MKLELTARYFDITPELQKYTRDKLERVHKKLPRGARAAAAYEVEFAQARGAEAKKFSTCGVTLTLPDGTAFTARETTQHMYSSLDVAAARIEQQIRDYAASTKRRPWTRLKRSLGGK